MLFVASKICLTSSCDKIFLRAVKSFDAIARLPPTEISREENSNSDDDLPPLDNLSPFEPASETNDEDLDDLPF